MVFQEDLSFPQGQGLKKRVEANISKRTSHLEDQSLDLDAKTMAVLRKRQQLSVRPKHCKCLCQLKLTLLVDREILASSC